MKKRDFAALAVVIAVAAACGSGPSGGSSTSVGSVASASAQSAASASAASDTADGPHVAAIKQKGFILIGTSPDFPPYESVDSSGTIVGFDVDLMDEIAKRIDVTLKWQDMPFDVTIASLQQGKVDISVSTHQKTPDNSTQVDFTDEYEPATTVFIERNDEDIKLEKPEDVALYKVGVQTGGTNEKWLQDHLVTPGLMPAANLATYERADDSLLDLLNGRLQLITSEGNTGAVYMQTKPVKFALITTKMNASNYVIAVPKGWDDLRELFNAKIKEIKADGTLERLEKKWNLVEPPPGA